VGAVVKVVAQVMHLGNSRGSSNRVGSSSSSSSKQAASQPGVVAGVDRTGHTDTQAAPCKAPLHDLQHQQPSSSRLDTAAPLTVRTAAGGGYDGALNKALQATAAQQCDTHLHARNVGCDALQGDGVALPLCTSAAVDGCW